MLVLGVYRQYVPYANGSELLGRAFTVIGTLWMLIAVVTLFTLIVQCFMRGANAPVGVIRILKVSIAVYITTHGTAKLWLLMSARSDGSLEGFFGNLLLAIPAMTLLILIPICFLYLVGVLGLEKDKKKGAGAEEKPLSVGKPKRFRALSGQLYEQTTTYYKKKAVTACVAIPG
jgi:hypothetical protein